MRITVRGHAKTKNSREVHFEGICERNVNPVVRDDDMRPAEARFRAGTVQCQKGGRLRPGSECVRCPRLVNLYPHGKRLKIRCLWTEQDRVASLMTLVHSLVYVSSDTTLSRAKEILANSKLHHLLVVDRGQLTGVVCQCDLAGETQADETVAHRANHCPWVIDDGANLAEAAALMVERKIGCLPVVRGRELRGVITKSDLLRIGVDVSELQLGMRPHL